MNDRAAQKRLPAAGGGVLDLKQYRFSQCPALTPKMEASSCFCRYMCKINKPLIMENKKLSATQGLNPRLYIFQWGLCWVLDTFQSKRMRRRLSFLIANARLLSKLSYSWCCFAETKSEQGCSSTPFSSPWWEKM